VLIFDLKNQKKQPEKGSKANILKVELIDIIDIYL